MAHPMGDMRLNTPYCTVLSSVWCLYFLHTLEGVKESRDVRNGPQNFFSAVRAGCLQPAPGLEQDFPVNSEWLGLVDQQAQHLQLLAGYNRA